MVTKTSATARRLAVIAVLAASIPSAALAYVGPGAGLSAIGTLIAVIGAVFLAIIGFVWYPVKRLLKGRKGSSSGEQVADDGNPKGQ